MNVNTREQPLLARVRGARDKRIQRARKSSSCLIRPVKMARETAFVSKSAIITTPGRCSTEMTPRLTRSRRTLGGTQDVLGLLEGDGVEGHADGGLAVAVDDAGAVDGKSKVDQ